MRSNFHLTVVVVSAVAIYLMVGSQTLAADQPSLRAVDCKLDIGAHGTVQIQVGDDLWIEESSYSFPGAAIGRNWLSEDQHECEPAWVPAITGSGDSAIVVAHGGSYLLKRVIERRENRIIISDTLTNRAQTDIGVIIGYLLRGKSEAQNVFVCGAAGESGQSGENPTIYLSQEHSSIGAVAEDDVFRAQFVAARRGKSAEFRLQHLALRPGHEITLKHTLYLFKSSADYFAFVNQVREDWGVNFTIPGPYDMFDVTREPYAEFLNDPQRLREFLTRSKLKVIAAGPWPDYDNVDRRNGKFLDRDQYKVLLRRFRDLVHRIDPHVAILGRVEAPFVRVSERLLDEMYSLMPGGTKPGFHEMNDEMLAALKTDPEFWQNWGDSLVWNRFGRPNYEYYERGRPMLAVTVRQAMGNGQHKFLMDQAKFILEDVGLDGLYIDSFGGSKHTSYGYSYDRWDGLTVDIDSKTGQITRRYTDLLLGSTSSREALLKYALDKGKMVVANDHPVSGREQPLPAVRFNESEGAFEPLSWADGEKPPLRARACEAQLSTPVALGFRPDRFGPDGEANAAKVYVKGAIAYLRHGVLYYHYGTIIPESGPGSYGPFNHMFPITPVRLGEGFVEGKQRIVTSVSHHFSWPHAGKPRILLFDICGRPKDHSIQPVETAGGWDVPIVLDDWQNIAVIEAAEESK